MSLRVGLGASQADLDVQGEIDFDFFEESNTSSGTAKSSQKTLEESQTAQKPENSATSCETSSQQNDFNSHKSESASSYNFNKPMITISCDDATGAIQKTIETVIPTPFSYKENKCGKKSPTTQNRKVALSPHLKSKIFKEDNEISDDSSISSMSGSESDVSSVSADSFELNEDDESDSMTDVSPLGSPFHTSSSKLNKVINDQNKLLPLNDIKAAKKEGVKFTDEVTEHKKCSKCETIDIHELLSAMKSLKMKQNINTGYARKCKSPVLTHNARCRKNLSFTNEEVRKIDNDNQVLLKKIVAQQSRIKPRYNTSANLVSAASVNRHKQQRQIEIENLALLKRLESTKPSKDLSRLHLLQDYDRRSSGVLSRSSSRSSYPCSSSQSFRTSIHSSGRSSAVSSKSSSRSTLRSKSLSVTSES